MSNYTIFYTGIGANKSGKHTKESFVRVMKAFVRKYEPMYEEKKTKFDKFTLKDWLKYSGAEMIRTKDTK